MPILFRVVCSVVAGFALAFALVCAVEYGSMILHPVPPGFKNTPEEICLHVERYPHWVLALATLAWVGTAYVSTWVTGRIGNRGSAAFVGGLLVVAALSNVAMLPYPLWFKFAIVLAIPGAVLLSLRSLKCAPPPAITPAV